MASAVLADNYQLKWHSHSTHLHTSVSTLYRSDNFTDVTLVTCDGRYLAAHRFVLSACSSYLNRVLQVGSIGFGPTSNVVVVLPPEISYRTLAILLQYMYSGEATVSNEQLNSVLRAGEVLRVKGLCHNPANKRFASGQDTPIPPSSREHSSESGHISNNVCSSKIQTPVIRAPERCNSAASTNTEGSVHKAPSSSRSGTDTSKTEDITKHTNKKHMESKSHSLSKDRNESHSSNERLSDEITVEENMKIELLVKEEPIDWNENDERNGNEDIDEPEVQIKSECYSPSECEENNLYAPLTCDMCQETFTTPALWVRHVETHPVTDVPRRKRKRNQTGSDDGEEDEYPVLRCELCQEVFTSPAEWVRHIQGSHTEEQLAMGNSGGRSLTAGGGGVSGCSGGRKSPRASCPSCAKTFPSIASMLIHSRTHTGEKPYVCCVCDKGFNVKSNLLRHLRTLHDHLVHPE